MKKCILSILIFGIFAIVPLIANQNNEYRIQLNDKITIASRKSFECIATIAHLAGFNEYNQPDTDYSAYDNYFRQYSNDKRVENAISYFKKLRKTGFSYDALANIAIYINPDCHSLRITDKAVLKANIQKRCGDPEKMIKILADFYDATNFDSFYKSQIPVYEKAATVLVKNKDTIITGVKEYEKYFRTEVKGLYISVSPIIGSNNYGTSFTDGKDIWYEPHYCVGYFDANIFIHEMSHPQTQYIVDELAKNKEIMKLVQKTFKGDKKAIMLQQAYSNPYTYIIELFNRANTNNILKGFTDDLYVAKSIATDRKYRFDEIAEVTELLDKYRTGSYKNQLEFLPEIEKGYIEILKHPETFEPKPFELSSEDTKSFTFLGRTYEAEYCGFQNLTGFRNFKLRKYWRLKNAYQNVNMYGTSDYLPYNNYPFQVNEGDVFRIEYLMNDGTGYFEYLRADAGDIVDGEPVTRSFFTEF